MMNALFRFARVTSWPTGLWPWLLAAAVAGWAGPGRTQATDPMDVASATPGELALLPEYCPHTWGYFKSLPERQAWFARLGPVFEHMHHYCWGLLKAQRAERLLVSPQMRETLYSSAIGECEYVLGRVAPDFVLRPEILLRVGQYHAALGRWQQALDQFELSRAAKADYWPAYLEAANVNSKLGRRQQAIDVLNVGLQVMPGEPRLEEALQRIKRQGSAAAPARSTGKKP